MKKSSIQPLKKSIIASATLLVIQLTVAQYVQAQEAVKADVIDPKERAPSEASISSGGTTSLDSTNIFNNATSPAQQSFIPGYELTGGKAGDGTGGTMTAPARGAPLVYGGLYVYLDARTSIGQNNNVLGAANNTISSSLFSLEPEAVAELKNHGDRYTASYLGNYARYRNSSSDDFNNHELKFAGDNIFDSRTRLSWLVGYNESTDPRGSTDRTLSSVPDQWHAPTVAGFFSYGAKDATGRVEIDGSYLDKVYSNNRTSTIAADVNISTVAARFFYRVAPKTSMFVEAKEIKSDYAIANSPNTNTDRRLMLGATWAATAATTGVFKIGYLNKSFDRQGVSGFKGVAWEGKAQWVPLTYSTFDFTIAKTPSDSTGVGDYVLNSNYGVSWGHRWNSQVGSKLDIGYVKSEYVNGNRDDNLKNIGLGVTYDFRRWMRFGVEVTNTNRGSTVTNNEFSRNVILFTLQTTL